MKSRVTLICVLMILMCTDVFAFGRRRRSYSRTSVSYSSGPVFSGTDQERAYAEAKYMSENRIYRHVGSTIGFYEGFGIGGPGCATCTPGRGMTLTADAHYGNVRVRAWR